MADGSEDSVLLIIIVVILFISLKWIFNRYNLHEIMFGTSTTSTASNSNIIPTTPLEKVFNPFSVAVCDNSPGTNQLTVKVTSDLPCWVQVGWGVLISEVYPLIHSPCSILCDDEVLSTNLSQISMHSEKCHLLPCDTSTENYILNKPTLDLGPVPRSRYPLVVIVTDATLPPHYELQDSNKIVSLITFIHLKDSICTANTHIFDQYIKTLSGKLHNIKHFYDTAADENFSEQLRTDDEQADKSGSAEEGRFCLVCLSCPISRVLLPCRHACLCENCCLKLVYCPVCRAVIISTFLIGH